MVHEWLLQTKTHEGSSSKLTHIIIHRQVYCMVPNFRGVQFSRLKTHPQNLQKLCSLKIWRCMVNIFAAQLWHENCN